MKKIIFSLCLLISFGFSQSFAQVNEKNATMSLGNQNSLTIELIDTKSKTAESVWKKFVEEYGKVKKNKKAKEFYMEEVHIAAINGNTPCDIYVKFEERAVMTIASFWIDLGDAFLNSADHPDRYQGAYTFFTEYGYAVEKYNINKELESAGKTLNGFEKDLKKLVKDNKSYHKNIEDAQEKIRKAEINLEKNVLAQQNKNSEITNQRSIIEEIQERLSNVGKVGVKVKIEDMKPKEKSEDKEKKDEGDGGKN